MAKQFTERFKVPINQAYGLTEASILTHFSDGNIPGSIGKPVLNVECKMINEKGKECRYGELCIRGPNIMKGYLNNKKATDACIDSDGWFHTGDLATVDKYGEW